MALTGHCTFKPDIGGHLAGCFLESYLLSVASHVQRQLSFVVLPPVVMVWGGVNWLCCVTDIVLHAIHYYFSNIGHGVGQKYMAAALTFYEQRQGSCGEWVRRR